MRLNGKDLMHCMYHTPDPLKVIKRADGDDWNSVHKSRSDSKSNNVKLSFSVGGKQWKQFDSGQN